MLRARAKKTQELAALWQCSTDHVLDLIHTGRLHAFSLSKPGSKRQRWRISDESIAEYESRHQAQGPVTPVKRQQKRIDAGFEFYK